MSILSTLNLGIRSSIVDTGGDPNFDNVVLLLKFDEGLIGETSFNDLSNDNRSITNYGNAALSDTQVKFGTTSLYCDGTQALYTGVDTNLNFSSGEDFTIEFWAYLIGSRFLFSIGNYDGTTTSFMIVDATNTNRGVAYSVTGDTGINNLVSLDTNTFNSWVHYAVTRNNNTVRFFIDGVSQGSASFSNMPDEGRCFIGCLDGTTSDLTPTYFSEAYFQEVRITRNVARYTSNFTPPTESFPES